MGGTVLVHKNWGTPQQTTVELRGLKNSEKNCPENVMFQFPERLDIAGGGSRKVYQSGNRKVYHPEAVGDV
jgi:hypothetical protein